MREISCSRWCKWTATCNWIPFACNHLKWVIRGNCRRDTQMCNKVLHLNKLRTNKSAHKTMPNRINCCCNVKNLLLCFNDAPKLLFLPVHRPCCISVDILLNFFGWTKEMQRSFDDASVCVCGWMASWILWTSFMRPYTFYDSHEWVFVFDKTDDADAFSIFSFDVIRSRNIPKHRITRILRIDSTCDDAGVKITLKS